MIEVRRELEEIADPTILDLQKDVLQMTQQLEMCRL